MIYLDTSVLVAGLTREENTDSVQAWLAAQDPDVLAVSGWVIAEFSSALFVKLRTGQIDASNRADAMATFRRFTTDSLRLLPIASLHFAMAARFADQHELSLRAGAALHLAVAADYGATLHTFDQKLARAALATGVSTIG